MSRVKNTILYLHTRCALGVFVIFEGGIRALLPGFPGLRPSNPGFDGD
jgi:hypothetical protein